MHFATDIHAMGLGQAGPTGEQTEQGSESFISVEMSCEGRLENGPVGVFVAKGGGIFTSTSGVGVAMPAAQDNLDRKTGCQGCHLGKDLP